MLSQKSKPTFVSFRRALKGIYRPGLVLLGLVFCAGLWPGVALAQLTPPSGPNSPSSQRPTLSQVYDKLTTGSASPTQSGFVGPTSGPSSTTMHSLNDLMALMPEVDDTNCAQPSDVIDGQTYWGLCSTDWGPQVGTASSVNDDWPIRLAATGSSNSFATGDDGDLQIGVTTSPRFTDNGDGTVTDNITDLIWLQDANCNGGRTWSTAVSDANNLANGSCGLTDGSSAGDWRLPNVRELYSVLDFGHYNPSIVSGHPFTNLQTDSYWTSTTRAPNTSDAWRTSITSGGVGARDKSLGAFVWPVR
ncbi:MAG: DUF1566 domain-containing protein [Candidatus Saccharibacteria bacterium]|nr:DUF1566 domain-containing protein [Candidatus Saccharibacteria bacterium]